jgi:hypothetical protein
VAFGFWLLAFGFWLLVSDIRDKRYLSVCLDTSVDTVRDITMPVFDDILSVLSLKV